MNHGIAIAKENIGDSILKGEEGIITTYLPEINKFVIYYGDTRCYTFTGSETELLEKFTIEKY